MPKHLETVKQKFAEVADHQEGKGILKYGQPLDPLDNYDWLDMALQEQVDGTKYLVAEMEKREFIVNKIKRLLVTKQDWINYDEVMHWLDELSGEN